MSGKLLSLLIAVVMLFSLCVPSFAEETVDVDAINCYLELHLHLDGSLSLASVRELAALQGTELPEDDAVLTEMLFAGEDCTDLNTFLEKFDLPVALLQSKEALQLATENLLREQKENGVIYAEVRFAPQLHTANGLSMEEAVQAVLEGMKHSDIYSNCILCCMRGEGNEQQNIETVRLAAEYLDKGVCAVDLAGAEGLYPTEDFDYIFALAKDLNVPFTIHAGEADGAESVKAAVGFSAKRIGHGVRSLESEEVIKLLQDNQVTLELCPTSNLRTGIYTDISEYPINTFRELGISVTVNTDDTSVAGTDIKSEFALLTDTFGFTKADIHELLYNSVNASFADVLVKEALKNKIDADMGYEQNTEPRKIIIDADMAADDATAILMALSESSVDVLGITVAAGNVSLEQAIDNALMTLEIAGRGDIPVFSGASSPVSGVERPTFSVFGNDGMGDMDMIHPTGKAADISAADFILNTLRENPGEVEIVCLAPATNLAECIKKDPEGMKMVKRVWSMGTSGLGIGNATPVAEFNVYKDAEAYEIFVNANLPTTIIGLDMDTEETFLTEPTFERMKNAGKANQYIEKAFRQLAEYKKKDFGYAFGDCPDGVAMACVLWPEFVDSSIRTQAVCITDNPECYGQVIFYREGISYDSMRAGDYFNTELITCVDKPSFVDIMITALDKLV